MRSVFECIRAGDQTALAEVLSANVDLDAMDEQSGESPLALAADLGDLAIVKLLLEAGADPNSLATTAWPLSNAAGRGNSEIVELLLDYGADVHAVDEDGGTALSDAAAAGHLAVVELLVEAGADARARDAQGKRPIWYAAEKAHADIVAKLEPLSTSTDRRQAEALLAVRMRGPVDPAVKAFHEAIRRCNDDVVQAYLVSGADIDAVDENGESAVFRAASRGNLSLIKRLEALGADLGRMNIYGTSALYFAACGNDGAAYDYLLPHTPKSAVADAEQLKNEKVRANLWKAGEQKVDDK
jgi:ankyrin repeat protein